MEKLKQARNKSNLMNEQAGDQPLGKKPYFIIDGKIMMKEASGMLKNYRDPATSKDSSSDGNSSPEAKNAYRAGAIWLPIVGYDCRRLQNAGFLGSINNLQS